MRSEHPVFAVKLAKSNEINISGSFIIGVKVLPGKIRNSADISFKLVA